MLSSAGRQAGFHNLKGPLCEGRQRSPGHQARHRPHRLLHALGVNSRHCATALAVLAAGRSGNAA
jgi:hypothetical protein